jgi:homoserine dehydrogenase
MGWISDPDGLDTAALLANASDPKRRVSASGFHSVGDWLAAAHANVVFEATALNAQAGQPAIDHIRAALEAGAHAITANKGPVVHAYEELTALAARHNRRFLFESTVMDGVPVFSLFRECLPAIHLRGFHGILNSTTNVILSGMEEGLSFDDSLKRAQASGVAETNPTNDIEGWDATVKVAALVRVLMGVSLPLDSIDCQGISNLTPEIIRGARETGMPYKLVCRAQRTENGVTASVRPEQLPLSDPMAWVGGTSSIIHFETDIFPGLTITEHHPGLEATAYGMLTDFVRAVSSVK